MSTTKKDMTGLRFGRYVVLREAEKEEKPKTSKSAHWVCQCDCGNIRVVNGSALRNGSSVSCGCYREARWMNNHRYRYGKRLYHIWSGMKSRCRNKNHDAYERYGGRGITVCREWDDYETFAQWAINNGYDESLTIERKDVNGNYCPENCTWITRGDQARNRRSNINIEFGGTVKTGAEWAREIGMGKHTVLRRLQKGMSIEEAITTPRIQPKAPQKKVYQYKDGELVAVWSCAKEAAEAGGYNTQTIRWACNSGGKRAYGFVWRYEEGQ